MAKKIRIPKKLGGYKLSKTMRRNLKWLLGLLDSAEGKAVIASGLAALATHFAEQQDSKKLKAVRS